MMAETPRRFIRIDDATWGLCVRRAQQEGTTVSAVVRRHLEEYANPGSVETELTAITERIDNLRKRME